MQQCEKMLDSERWTKWSWGLIGLFIVACALPTFGQSTVTSTSQLQTAQAQAESAVLGTSKPTSVVLRGTFTSSEGSLNQTGNAQLTVGSDGSYSIDLSRNVGAVNESRTVADGIPACTWTDQTSVVHKSAFLNCLPPAWFFPGLALFSGASSSTSAAWTPSTYFTDALGNHLQFQFSLPLPAGQQEDPQFLKPFDLVLSPATNLPQYALFTVHPDNPGINADIPVKIAYLNYQSVSGVAIPFHIQRYVNGGLVLDLVIANATVQ